MKRDPQDEAVDRWLDEHPYGNSDYYTPREMGDYEAHPRYLLLLARRVRAGQYRRRIRRRGVPEA